MALPIEDYTIIADTQTAAPVGRLVGNFRQAFSHVRLIDTTRTLTDAVAATEARAREGRR